LTTAGTENYEYGGSPGDSTHAVTDVRHGTALSPSVIWSPDSQYILTHQLDERKVKEMFLVQSAPTDGGARPILYKYRYALPGDDNLPLSEPVVIDVSSRKVTKIATPPLIGTWETWASSHYAWWSADSSKIYYLNLDRFSKSVSLNIVNPVTGHVRELLNE